MSKVWVLLAALLVVACSAAPTVAPSATPQPPTPTLTPPPAPSPTPTFPPTPTQTPTPEATPIALPTATLPPTETPTPLPPVTQGQEVAMAEAARPVLPALGDLPGYDIRATLDMQALAITGSQRVIYANRRGASLSEVYFNLYPNAPRFGGRMTVADVTVDGQPAAAEYVRDGRALRVPLPESLPAGERASIEMSFALHVPQVQENRFRVLLYSKGILSLAGWYPSLAVLDDDGWHLDYPDEEIGEAMFSESAFYTVQIAVPQDLVVAATGVQVGETVQDATQGERTRALTYRSGPSRTFYLSASTAYQVLSAQAGETAVHSYHLPGHEACGQWVLEAAVAALDLYGRLYGPYPFAEYDVVEADQWYQGMEWPGLMLLGSVFYDGSDAACGEWFVAHEVAHQWWYNAVGNDPLAHPWLDEALAQYSAMLYFRRLWPPEAAEAYIQPIIYARYAPYADRPGGVHVGQPTTAFEDREAYYAIVYARGAMFLEALHEALGEDAFLAALQAYYRQNQFQIVAPEALKAALLQGGGEQVERLWAEWVVAP